LKYTPEGEENKAGMSNKIDTFVVEWFAQKAKHKCIDVAVKLLWSSSVATVKYISRCSEVEWSNSEVKEKCMWCHAKKITSLMVEMLVLDLRPTAKVEGVGLKRLIN